MITLLQESSNINEQQIMSYSVKLFDELSKDINSKLDALSQEYSDYESLMLHLIKTIKYKQQGSCLTGVDFYAEPDILKDGGPCWFGISADSFVDYDEFFHYLWDKDDSNLFMGNLYIEKDSIEFLAPGGEHVAEFVFRLFNNPDFLDSNLIKDETAIMKKLITQFVTFISDYCDNLISNAYTMKSTKYQVLKDRDWYDPEGLGIKSKPQVVFTGTYADCVNWLKDKAFDAKKNSNIHIEEFTEDKLVLYYPNAIAKNTFFIK